MKYLIILIGFLTSDIIACSGDFSSRFVPFAVELENRQVEPMSVYEINFPIKKSEEAEFYLSSITAYLNDLFSFNVEYVELPKYKDRYYTVHLTLNQSIVSKIKLNARYLSLNKEGIRRAACINHQSISLSEMLENIPVTIR